MSWARIDDAFDDHPKVLALLEYEQGAAAIGLWTLCLTWAHRNTRRKGKVPGQLPASLPRRYLGPGARELAELLVTEKLWEDRGPEGWMIHDFERYLPTEQTRDARSEAGKRGAQARWGKRAGRDSNLPSGDSKPMASDGSGGPSGTEKADSDPGSPRHPLVDSKEPSADSNLPSGLLPLDGKPMASDGSRAPARRAISKEIAPTPAPAVIPATPAADTAQTLIAEWLDHCRKRPPDRVIGQVSKELAALLAEGQDVADIRTGLARWHQAGKHPSTLASFVNEVMNASPSGTGRTSPNGRKQQPVNPRDEWKFNRS